MSSYLYGNLSSRRLSAAPGAPLSFDARVAEPGGTKDPVGHWTDVLVALVPAEALAIHTLAMTLGTTTTAEGASTSTVITKPTEMAWVFWFMMAIAGLLCLVGAKRLGVLEFIRALVASTAFVLWTMIQPTSAFDALGWNPSPLVRTMIAIGGAVVLGSIAAWAAGHADKTTLTG
ncbi:hypothetical protein OG558_23700 [Kribbella sp. NBC_01510]|uniref:hypothetical protein n=1 Tax=Kribbella sp. NBC_01510 TaxID=2903581 RepID=UPI003869B0A9